MYYGQFETDKIIETYFDGAMLGSAIEVGAYNGIKGSNTKYFEDLGWNVLCIEPNPIAFMECVHCRQHSVHYAVSSNHELTTKELKIFKLKSGIESTLTALVPDERLKRDYGHDIVEEKSVAVPALSLDEIIKKHFNRPYIDFISIDTEGTELDVLHGLDLTKTRPKLLIIENNYEDPEITFYMSKYGYKHDQRYKINDFYVRT